MDRKDLASMLRRAGVPVVHIGWPDGSDPDYPYIAYRFVDNDGSFDADNYTFAEVQRWQVQLLTHAKDDDLESAIEQILRDEEIPHRKQDAGTEGGDYHEVLYTFRTF